MPMISSALLDQSLLTLLRVRSIGNVTTSSKYNYCYPVKMFGRADQHYMTEYNLFIYPDMSSIQTFLLFMPHFLNSHSPTL